MNDFAQYCALIEGDRGSEEREELILAITTNVTSFFREMHHFDYLRERILPELVDHARSGGRVRIWSAACSSGEEPYSIALTLLGVCPDAAKLNIRILATDIDKNVLARAAAGQYGAQATESIPKPLVQKYIQQKDANADTIQISDAAKALITFKPLNLLQPWPVKGPFDAIFCRNVVIYFYRPTQVVLWNRFLEVMPSDSHIMIGHSERVAGAATSQLKPVGITTYQKT